MAPMIFIFLFILILIFFFFDYKTIETHVRVFLPLNISAVGSVNKKVLFCFGFDNFC